MHRLNRFNSVEHLLPLFSATATATTAVYRKRSLRLCPPFRSLSHVQFPRRRIMDPPSPTADAGVDDFVKVGEEDQIPREEGDNSPENEVESESIVHNVGNHGNERKILPPELARSAVTLTCDSIAEGGFCDVYLVGTAHVSTDSCNEVQAVIDFLKPQVVFLELCPSRIAVLAPQDLKVSTYPVDKEIIATNLNVEEKVPTVGEMVEMWKKNQNPFAILYTWFLAKVASKLEVFPGGEFRVAYEEAMKYGAKVILGDRPVQITLRRTWAVMPLWHKIKLIYSLFFQAIFLPSPEDLTKALKEMDDVDMLTLVIQEMSKQFPTLMETLVRERDQYMSATLLSVAREHNSVVAVVGKGHLPGIQKNWEQPVEMKQLQHIPSRSSMGKIVSNIGVAVAGVAIVSGIYLSLKK